jgi:hypothetical protein
MAPKYKEGDIALSFSGKWISWVHTVVAFAAFLGALVTGVSLHYKKIVENEHYVCCFPQLDTGWLTFRPGLSAGMVSFSLCNHW